MSGVFHPYDPRQQLLLPPALQDWLPEGHLAYFISDTVDQLDIRPILAGYRKGGKGELAYHPSMMLKVLIYAYATGVFASRKIAAQLQDSVAFRVLAAGQFPSHRTICRFRQDNLDHFQDLFVQVVQIARSSGIAKLGTIAVDGSKVKANASKHKAMSYKRMREEEKRLRKEIRELTRVAQEVDEIDDQKYGPDFRGDELPEELKRRKDRLKTIQEAKRRLEERKAAEARAEQEKEAREDRERPKKTGAAKRKKKGDPELPKDKDQENFTDPDSRIMKSGGGFVQAYNVQIAVDEANQVIVANEVGQCSADSRELLPMLDEVEKNTGIQPTRVLADAGYKSEENFRELEKRQIDAYVAVGRESKKVRAGRADQEATERMRRKLKTKPGRHRYKKRKHIVEPAFGWLKQALGFRSFMLRGLRKVRGELDLACLALDLRRMNQILAW